MTLRIVLYGIKRHEVYYLNDIFMCRFTSSVECKYDDINDSYVFMFFNVSRESMNEIIATVDRQMDAFNYEYITEDEDLGFIFTTKYCVHKKEDGFDVSIKIPPRGSAKTFLNDIFGMQSDRYSMRKRHGDMYKVKAIYNGIERATGKFKTVVEWSDGTKTIVTSQNDNHLSRELAFSYAWVKKQYGSNSAFKRHVDKHVETWGYAGQIFFNDGDYQAQLSVRTKSNDIYDQVALVMTMKDFGGIEKVADILQEKTYE